MSTSLEIHHLLANYYLKEWLVPHLKLLFQHIKSLIIILAIVHTGYYLFLILINHPVVTACFFTFGRSVVVYDVYCSRIE